jgi:hypothetical protein
MSVPVADEIAEVLTSGATGVTLLRELQERFASASRWDFIFGVAQAISVHEAWRVGLLLDLTMAQRSLPAELTGSANG